MNICIIDPRIYQLFNESVYSGFGGAQVQFTLLAKALSKMENCKISIIVGDHGQAEREFYGNIELIKSFKVKDSILFKILKSLKAIRKAKAQVFMQRSLTPYSGIIALLVRLLGKKFVYMIAHDFEVDGNNALHKSIFGRFLSKLLFKKANIIVAQNQYQLKHLENRGIKALLIKSSVIIEETISSEKKAHLWLGRTEKFKQPELFLDLAEHFPDEKFMMVCPRSYHSDLEIQNQLKNRAKELGNVEFYDEYLPYSQVSKVLSVAKTIINTSVAEGFPNTFLQAGVYKIPILSLAVDPDNFIDHFDCGFYCSNNFDMLLSSFQILSESVELCSNKGLNAYNYVFQHHNIEINSKTLFHKICGLFRG